MTIVIDLVKREIEHQKEQMKLEKLCKRAEVDIRQRALINVDKTIVAAAQTINVDDELPSIPLDNRPLSQMNPQGRNS